MTPDAPPHPGDPYFAAVGDRLGEAYLRYDFTMGTDQEVDFLVDLLQLPAGARILDVGCGPGRHAVKLASLGYAVTGIDVSERFLEIAAHRAREAGVSAAFFVVDARQMPFDDEFEAVVSLCQGGFGLMGRDDSLVLRRIAEALRPGGRAIVTAFSSYFEVAAARPEAAFDADSGVVYEKLTIRDEAATEHVAEAWTSVYTPRELRLLALGVGLEPEHVWSVEPGKYARSAPNVETPEFMLVARKPE